MTHASPDQIRLAAALAEGARRLRAAARARLAAHDERLARLRSAWPGAEDGQLADAVAQTLGYALVCGRALTRGDSFTLAKALAELPASTPLLAALFELAQTNALAAELEEIVALLGRRELERDAIVHVYEHFLDAYDGERRRRRGVYFTPGPIVRYMVGHALALIERPLLDGNVRVVDPATGTGAFPRELLRRAHERGSALAFARALGGFELMVTPHAICHLQLGLELRARLGGELEPLPELAIARGDALAQPEPRESSPWTFVIGNPPYRNNSAATLAQIAARFPGLLESSRAAAAAQARNIRDDYAWFFAAADSMVEGGGAICLVSSDSYLKKESYRHFRAALLRRHRILRLTRLGEGIFAEVGPRIGFAIALLERRAEPLASAELADPFPLVDLGPLAHAVPPQLRGTPEDPRMAWLDAAADIPTLEGLPSGARIEWVTPRRRAGLRLLPQRATAPAPAAGLQIVARSPSPHRSLFVRKWPGVITAFDRLLKDASHERLAARMSRLFELAHAPRLDPAALDAFAEAHALDAKGRGRIEILARQARAGSIEFSPARIVPTFGGSISPGEAWAPPVARSRFIYYEPELHIPRNLNPGKARGWGSMEQLREPASHRVFPKLIFTTSTNPKYGFVAFVVDGGWYAKLGGASSQQFNYVGLRDPCRPVQDETRPNNLSEAGLELLARVRAGGLEDADLFHVIAAIYNSSYGRSYAQDEADMMLPLPALEGAPLAEIARAARRLRALRGAAEPPSDEPFPRPPGSDELELSPVELREAITREQDRLDRLIEATL